jgi:hypothetical protein
VHHIADYPASRLHEFLPGQCQDVDVVKPPIPENQRLLRVFNGTAAVPRAS